MGPRDLGHTAEQMEAEVKKIADAVASPCNVAATAMVGAIAETGEQAAKILTNLYGQSFDAVKQLLSGRFPDDEINDAIRSLPGGDEFMDFWNGLVGR